MKRIKWINTDQIGVNPPNRSHPWSIPELLSFLIAVSLLPMLLVGCRNESNPSSSNASNENTGRGPSGLDAAAIIERYRALDNSHDSTTKMRARISSSGNSEEINTPRQIQMTMYRNHEPDGRIMILIEFTSPAEERDRDGLITVYPDGRIEGVRYVQSTDSFILTTDSTSEDAVFGMTLQELAEGQPEKYDFSLAGDETYNGTPVYRMEGKLKASAESKFPRITLLISKQNFAALQAEFYDNHNELARQLTVSKTGQIAGRWARTAWSIDNRARQKKIDFEAVDVKYDQNLSDSIFTREHLRKIASR
jgi:outer membrane lipoprotein-sorting protein